jgi:DNA recombination protein RmuC
MSSTLIVLAILNLALIAFIAFKKTSVVTDSSTSQNTQWLEKEISDLKVRLAEKEQESKSTYELLAQERLAWTNERAELNAENKLALERVANEQERIEEMKKDAQEAKEKMKLEFKELAQTILEEKSKNFKDTNSEELDKLLAPFKQKLEDFEKTVKDSHKEESKNSAVLMENIKALKEMNDKLSEEASGLAKALRGDNKKQGNWGEFVLERALEMSGLGKDKEYFVQNSETTSDGRRLQPDVIIQLPGNKKIIIDSKVSLVAWDHYVNDASEDPSGQLKQLAASIQTHIKGLSEKDYPQLYGGDTPEFVLLFIPIEAAFMEVTKFDQGLYEFAFSRKIILVSTSTLLATLKTIAMAWRQEKQTRNVIEIAEAGGRLYDKFVGLSEDLTKLGQQFNTAQKTYQDSMSKMVEGKGNLITQVQKLKQLGSKTKKELDQRLVDRADLGEFSDKQIGESNAE